MAQDITYVFRGDKAYALHKGKVVASSGDLDALEAHVKKTFAPEMSGLGGGPVDMPPEPERHPAVGPAGPIGGGGEPCPECGGVIGPDGICPECGFPETAGHPGGMITTPNGLQGQVLGKVAALWGDEVTIRLENGRIVRLPVSKGMRFASTKPEVPQQSPIETLEARLASTPSGTRDSLAARFDALVALKRQAALLLRDGVSYADQQRLDGIVVTADAEMAEVQDAINHLDADTTEAYAPPAPYSMGVADEAAASMGGLDGSWLDQVTNDMIAEVEATDFKNLMDEGPEALVAEQPDVALGDAGIVRQTAASFIRSKTAGTDPEIRDPYERTFLARVEDCRRTELAARKQTLQKEAAQEEDKFKDLPDDVLFMG